MEIVKRIPKAIIKYDNTFDTYVLGIRNKKNEFQTISFIELAHNTLSVGRYIKAYKNDSFNLIKIGVGSLQIDKNNKFHFVGAVSTFKQ